MNCLEFHRLKLADPRRVPAEAQAHAQECAACAAFAREVEETEQALEGSLAVPVPDGLAERVLLASREPRGRSKARWALAASLTLSVAVATAWLAGRPGDAYARLAIEHVTDEPASFTVVHRPADPEAFATVVRDFGGRLTGALGEVRYMKLCPVDDGVGWHIVFDTPEGMATLILVPGKKLERVQKASAEGWSALARPTPRGYYVVVTPSAEATERVDRLVRELVDWDA